MWWYVYVIMSFYVIPFLRFSSWITLQGVAHVYPFLTNKHCGELHKRVASIPVGGFVWRVGFGAERSARSVEWLGARGQGEDSGIPMDSPRNPMVPLDELVDISICTEHVQALKCAQWVVFLYMWFIVMFMTNIRPNRQIHEYSLHGAAHMSIHVYVYTSTSILLYLM